MRLFDYETNDYLGTLSGCCASYGGFTIQLYGGINMRTKTFLISVLLILAVALAACAPTAITPAQSTQPTQVPAPRTLSVNGSAVATLTPDIAYISIGVHTENADSKVAVSDNNSESQKVSDAITSMGVDPKDILTKNFSISPQDVVDSTGKKTGTTFVVDNTIYVTLRDLSKIGDLLNAAVAAGANSIYGIQFDVADKTPVLASARKAAVDNAHTQAVDLAQAAGVTLGQVQSISFYNSTPVPLTDYKAGAGVSNAVAASVPIAPGQLTITVDVSIVYEIK